jgi:hypothetical protein
MFYTTRLYILARSDTHNALENSLQVIGADVHLFTHTFERKRFFTMCLDIATDILYQFYLWIVLSSPLGMAAPTWAKTCLFSLLGYRKEYYLLSSGSSRRTGGFAVDASRAYCVEKCSI